MLDKRRPASVTGRLSLYLRRRTAVGRKLAVVSAGLKARSVPVHWTNAFGVVTLASLIVLFVTGVALMFAYQPSSETVSYSGGYAPLHGVEVSRAFDSVMRLSFDVPGGLILRQLHHWSALLVPASIMLQLLVSFFTGAFRRPRRAAWVLLFLLLIVVLAGGWSGYALPDDMLSGSGLRIVQGIVLGIPLIGSWLSAILFGGGFPGSIIENLYLIHVLIVPLGALLLVAARARAAHRAKPPQFAGPGRRNNTVVGIPMIPTAATRSAGLLALVAGILVLISTTVQINPIGAYGPSDPGRASAGSQPDWYTGFLDGALRLVPSGWEVEWLGRTWTLAVLAPLVVVGIFLLLVALYPFIEEWISQDKADHHILDRPRNVATRTGIGVAGMTFYGVLWLAASADIISLVFRVSFESVIAALQITLVVGPVAAFTVTKRVCIALQRKDRELVLHGYETGRIVRLPGGGYVEVHAPIGDRERARLTAHAHTLPVPARMNMFGQRTVAERVRGMLSSWFFRDRIEMPLQAGESERIASAEERLRLQAREEPSILR